MVKKRKNKFDDYDSYQDYEDDQSAMDAAQPEVTKIHLSDFMVPEKVSAFVHDYEPCDEFDPGAERFDDARLREYFKAYVCGLGDPLSLYLEDLKLAAEPFRMVTSLATNEPAIFARRKHM